jgi:spermidine/putrescine transport system ATP-binding protein
MWQEAAGGQASVRLGEFPLTATCVNGARPGPGRVVIRPERVRLELGSTMGDNTLPAMVDNLVYVGATTQVVVRLSHGPVVHALVVNDRDRDDFRPGTAVILTFPADSLRLLAQPETVSTAA